MLRKQSRTGAEMPIEGEQCSYGHGPPERNCILQYMKSNSRLYHKCFCRRKICFTFRGSLCILISLSGTAAAVTLLSSRQCPHQIYSHVLSGFLLTAWFNRLEASWWQCCQQHNVICCKFVSLPPRREACAAALCSSFIYVQKYTNIAVCLP